MGGEGKQTIEGKDFSHVKSQRGYGTEKISYMYGAIQNL